MTSSELAPPQCALSQASPKAAGSRSGKILKAKLKKAAPSPRTFAKQALLPSPAPSPGLSPCAPDLQHRASEEEPWMFLDLEGILESSLPVPEGASILFAREVPPGCPTKEEPAAGAFWLADEELLSLSSASPLPYSPDPSSETPSPGGPFEQDPFLVDTSPCSPSSPSAGGSPFSPSSREPTPDAASAGEEESLFRSLAPAALCSELPFPPLAPSDPPSPEAEALYLEAIRRHMGSASPGFVFRLDAEGYSVVHYASAAGFLAVLGFLEETSQGAALSLTAAGGHTPLQLAIRGRRHDAVAWLLERRLGSAESFQTALEVGDVDTVELFLKTCVVEVNGRNQSGQTPLHTACSLGAPKVVKLLLQWGANPSLKDPMGSTPLCISTMLGHHGLVEELSSDRALLESTDRLGRTPLHWAAAMGDLHAVKVLAKSGAKLEPKDRRGRTPFLLASFASHSEIATFLAQKKANKELEDFEGRGFRLP